MERTLTVLAVVADRPYVEQSRAGDIVELQSIPRQSTARVVGETPHERHSPVHHCQRDLVAHRRELDDAFDMLETIGERARVTHLERQPQFLVELGM
jgi:hypothetical protein